jgi:hypothetical protein
MFLICSLTICDAIVAFRASERARAAPGLAAAQKAFWRNEAISSFRKNKAICALVMERGGSRYGHHAIAFGECAEMPTLQG